MPKIDDYAMLKPKIWILHGIVAKKYFCRGVEVWGMSPTSTTISVLPSKHSISPDVKDINLRNFRELT
jgi:hypothetical protein